MGPARPAPSRRRAPQPWRRDERAVNDVVGTLVLVAMTIVGGAGVGLGVLTRDGPSDDVHADLAWRVTPGADATWGTGDEVVYLRHTGGEPVEASNAAITVLVNGTPSQTTAPATAGFGDGRLEIGEQWSQTLTITRYDDVIGAVQIGDDGQQALLAQGMARRSHGGTAPAAACGGDTTPPSASFIAFHPADITALTIGPATITLALSDDCSGVNQTTPPTLYWRINGGGSPPWNDAGTMDLVATSTWQGQVPDPLWLLQVGQDLEVYMDDYQDENGNAGTTGVANEYIDAGLLFDPGFAYHDVNCDDAYDAGTDVDLSSDMAQPNIAIDVANCLVVPAGAGPVTSLLGISLQGSNVYIGADLNATAMPLFVYADAGAATIAAGSSLWSTSAEAHVRASGDIYAEGVDIASGTGQPRFNADGTAYINGSSIRALGNKVNIDADAGLWAHNTTWYAFSDIDIDSLDGPTHMQDADFRALDDILIDSNKADMHLERAYFDAVDTIHLDVNSGAYKFYVQDAEFHDGNDQANSIPNGAAILGTPAYGGIA